MSSTDEWIKEMRYIMQWKTSFFEPWLTRGRVRIQMKLEIGNISSTFSPGSLSDVCGLCFCNVIQDPLYL